MSEEENFLSRWSRKKREAADDAATAPVADPQNSAPSALEEGDAPNKTEKEEPKFDLASLPSIDSIGPATDIRAFLLPGVPAELTRAALRRVWTADPAIRDFIGLSENSWDFTKSGGVPGFDLSDPGIDVKRLAEEMFGSGRKPDQENSPETLSICKEGDSEAPTKPPDQPDKVAIASDHDILNSQADSIRKGTDSVSEQGLLATQKNLDTAMQHDRETDASPNPVRKRHGGALPS